MEKAKQTPEKRERVREWDVLRTAAFAGVVLQHLLGAWLRRAEIGRGGLYFCTVAFEPLRFAVPMFVFLFGCSLFYTHRDRPLRCGAYFKKRLLQLALPYALWTVFYLYTAGTALTPRALARSLLLGEGKYHLWYVVMILQFVLLAPVLLALRRRLRGHAACAAAVLFAAWLLYLALTPQWSGGGLLGSVFVRRRTLVFASWFGYFLLGALCGIDRQRFTRWAVRLLPLTGTVYLASMLWAAYLGICEVSAFGRATLSSVSFLEPSYAVFTLCGILFWYAAACRIAQRNGAARVCAFVGRHSYEAYLAHVWVLTKCSLFLLERWPSLRLTAFYVVLTVMTFAGTLLLAWAIDSAARGLRMCLRKTGGTKTAE